MECGIYATEHFYLIKNKGVDIIPDNIKHITIQSNLNFSIPKIKEVFKFL